MRRESRLRSMQIAPPTASLIAHSTTVSHGVFKIDYIQNNQFLNPKL